MQPTVEGMPIGLVRHKDGLVSAFRKHLGGLLTGCLHHEFLVADHDRVARAGLLIFEGDFDAFPVVGDFLWQLRPLERTEIGIRLRKPVDPFRDLHHQTVEMIGVLGIEVDRFDPPTEGLHHAAEEFHA